MNFSSHISTRPIRFVRAKGWFMNDKSVCLQLEYVLMFLKSILLSLLFWALYSVKQNFTVIKLVGGHIRR